MKLSLIINIHKYKIYEGGKIGSLPYSQCFAWSRCILGVQIIFVSVWKNNLWHCVFCILYRIFVFKYIYTWYSILCTKNSWSYFFNCTFIIGEVHGTSYYICTSGSLFSYYCKIWKYMIVESFLERPSKDFGSVSNFLTV